MSSAETHLGGNEPDPLDAEGLRTALVYHYYKGTAFPSLETPDLGQLVVDIMKYAHSLLRKVMIPRRIVTQMVDYYVQIITACAQERVAHCDEGDSHQEITRGDIQSKLQRPPEEFRKYLYELGTEVKSHGGLGPVIAIKRAHIQQEVEWKNRMRTLDPDECLDLLQQELCRRMQEDSPDESTSSQNIFQPSESDINHLWKYMLTQHTVYGDVNHADEDPITRRRFVVLAMRRDILTDSQENMLTQLHFVRTEIMKHKTRDEYFENMRDSYHQFLLQQKDSGE